MNEECMGSTSYQKDPPHSQVPIVFLGEALPLGTYWLELLGSFLRNQPDPLPDAVKNWLLDLHYCSGIVRRSRSDDVMSWIRVVRKNLLEKRIFLLDKLADWGFDDGELLYADWLVALDKMEQLASMRPECEWTRKGSIDPKSIAKWILFLEKHSGPDPD